MFSPLSIPIKPVAAASKPSMTFSGETRARCRATGRLSGETPACGLGNLGLKSREG